MNNQSTELLEKIRHQFDNAPYPRTPLDRSPKEAYETLFTHSLVTPYYLKNQRVIETKGKVILDAGCGTGFTSLALAEANPGARIVGIDLSEESVDLARQRFQYHGVKQGEFHTLAIEDLPKLELEFDYINCDEVLYLLPDLEAALASLKSVLKPEGILRGNLHSAIQRFPYYRAQKLFKLMGLLDSKPGDAEIAIAMETMKALEEKVDLKMRTWNFDVSVSETVEEDVFLNYLLQGDKGYTIPEMFAALEAADLAFLSMVNWRQWDLMELFKEPDNLPVFWQFSLPEVSVEQNLRLFELMQPIHRLLDFWCTHSDQVDSPLAIAQWEPSDWHTAKVHLHPVLRSDRVKADLMEAIAKHHVFEISRYITITTVTPIALEASQAACLLPLWEGAQTVETLSERWLQIRPVNPATLEPISKEAAFGEVTDLLRSLEVFLYVLLSGEA
jgi:2-polyprenyl-3-methyl-5-hydroxy-6-metoxy-1,4-benzoquinol methylase